MELQVQEAIQSKEVTESEKEEEEIKEVTSLAHPPEMPIVIDDNALEDILGVSTNYNTFDFPCLLAIQ